MLRRRDQTVRSLRVEHYSSAVNTEQLAEAKRRRSTGWYPPEDLRYQQRGAAERVNANFKDNFAGRLIRLRGADKIECHCLLALTAIAAIQIVRLLE